MISDLDLQILIVQDDWTLAEWYCLLNVWKWPTELPDSEPPNHIPGGRRSQIMNWIHEIVGERLISRVRNKKMTDEEFEDFWNRNQDPEARARYNAYLERCFKIQKRLYSPEFDAPLV